MGKGQCPLEDMVKNMPNSNFWKNKKVFITGHTGFKGTWLCLWLIQLGAKVTGYSLDPPTTPNLFHLCKVDKMITSIKGDIRDQNLLEKSLNDAEPDIIFHLAAQSLVRDSYRIPVETYETNVMGTVYLLDVVRRAILKGKKIKAFINITTDKCYENKEWVWGYRETDRLGGFDPYSNSKACSELVTDSFRNSFFPVHEYNTHGFALASVRAGNVIGGGDWSYERLIPDCIRALLNKQTILLRNPNAVRPWQYVLEPLSGYLLLAEKLYEHGTSYDGAWNFGPSNEDCRLVSYLVEQLCKKWVGKANFSIEQNNNAFHEAQLLKLDCSKALTKLGWKPRWNIDIAIDKIIEWSKSYELRENIKEICFKQIKEYSES